MTKRAAGIAWTAVLGVVVACSEPPTEISPPVGERAQFNQASDNGRLAQLRQTGEGCAIAAPDSKGVLRAIAVERSKLPFHMPPIHRDPKTGIGNGRVAGMKIQRPDSPEMTLTCWAPETLSLDELSAAVMTSKQDVRWDRIIAELEGAAELPDSDHRQLSDEARTFAGEMLASPLMHKPKSGNGPANLVADPRIARVYQEGFGCGSAYYAFIDFYYYDPFGISCWYGGGGWFISISFYWYYYDYYYDWYAWLMEEGYRATQSCGDKVLDDIKASYYNSTYFSGTLRPSCPMFDQDRRTRYFSHAQLSQGNGTSWAILYTALTVDASNNYGADKWVDEYYADSRGYPSDRVANSGYRTPKHNKEVGGALGSQHMYGDALDLNNNSSIYEEWEAMYDAAGRANADFREPFGTLYFPTYIPGSYLFHVHADWRNH